MQCRVCGTEIARKALICYRCGTAVDEPVAKPTTAKRPRPLVVYLSVAILALVAIAAIWFR